MVSEILGQDHLADEAAGDTTHATPYAKACAAYEAVQNIAKHARKTQRKKNKIIIHPDIQTLHIAISELLTIVDEQLFPKSSSSAAKSEDLKNQATAASASAVPNSLELTTDIHGNNIVNIPGAINQLFQASLMWAAVSDIEATIEYKRRFHTLSSLLSNIDIRDVDALGKELFADAVKQADKSQYNLLLTITKKIVEAYIRNRSYPDVLDLCAKFGDIPEFKTYAAVATAASTLNNAASTPDAKNSAAWKLVEALEYKSLGTQYLEDDGDVPSHKTLPAWAKELFCQATKQILSTELPLAMDDAVQQRKVLLEAAEKYAGYPPTTTVKLSLN